MKVGFRVDASSEIGSGHVIRCLTLATELRRRGATCRFICRRQPGDLTDLVRASGFELDVLPALGEESTRLTDTVPHAHWLGCSWSTDAHQTRQCLQAIGLDWLMVDHYGIDYRWERTVRDAVARLGVIDDLADRRHAGELLLDQSFYADFETRYDHLVPPGCQLFLGPAHVLLRSEFEAVRASLRQRDGSVRRILVFFGADTKEQTAAAVRGLARLGRTDLSVDVVFTGTAEHLGRLQEACAGRPNLRLHSRVANMAELVGRADLGIGAGGTAMWERCYLGLPSITVTFADNQLRAARDTAALGAIQYLGHFDELAADAYERAIAELLASPARMRQLTAASLQLVESGTAAVAQALFEHCATSH